MGGTQGPRLKGEHWSKNTFYGSQEKYLLNLSEIEKLNFNASFSSKSLPKNESCPPPSWSRN